ncbi:MAG: hypothetical protein ACLSA2_02255 [Candidatus Gastranaerophilaceae bacterium]
MVVPNRDYFKECRTEPYKNRYSGSCAKWAAILKFLIKTVSGEEVGDIQISYSELKACKIEGEIIPKLIDELPVIAVLPHRLKALPPLKMQVTYAKRI